MNNRDVDMSSHLVTGMEYKAFFGLHGALPMAFTERILHSASQEGIISFFDEVFANFIVKNEQTYYALVHSYINLFKRKKNTKKTEIKFVSIDKRFNQIGVTNVGQFLLGKKAPTMLESHTTMSRLGEIYLV